MLLQSVELRHPVKARNAPNTYVKSRVHSAFDGAVQNATGQHRKQASGQATPLRLHSAALRFEPDDRSDSDTLLALLQSVAVLAQ